MNDSENDIPDLVDSSSDDNNDSIYKSLRICAAEWMSKDSEFKKEQEVNIKILVLAPYLFSVDDLLPKSWTSIALNIKTSFQKSSGEDFDFSALELLETMIDKTLECMKFYNLEDILDSAQEIDVFFEQNSMVCADLMARLTKNPTICNIWQSVRNEPLILDRKLEALFVTLCVLKHYHDIVLGFLRNGCDFTREKREKHQWTQRAEDYKKQGNKEYQYGNYDRAIKWYSESVKADPFNHIYYGNRAQAYFKISNFKKAWEDGRRTITLKPDWAKAQYRHAQALYELGELQKAVQANQKAIEICSKGNHKSEDMKILIDQKTSFDKDVNGNGKRQKKPAGKHPAAGLSGDKCTGEQGNDFFKVMKMTRVTDDNFGDILSKHFGASDADLQEMKEAVDFHKQNKKNYDDVPDLTSSDSDRDNSKPSGSGKRSNKSQESFQTKAQDGMDDVPDLTSSDSDNDADKQDVTERKYKRSKKTSKTKVQEGPEAPSEDSKALDDCTRVRNLMTQGSVHYMEGNATSAVSRYQRALDLISSTDLKKFEMKTEELVILKFVFGLAAASTMHYKTISEGIEKLRSIVSFHKEVYFPQAFYGIGKSYVVLNRFELAIDPLSQGLKMITNKKKVKEYPFPGMNDKIIDETRQSHVKQLMEDNLELCRFPPAPDAVCKYHTQTEELRTVIYLTDPDFKGFVRIACDSVCKIEFHIVCWKSYRNEFGDKVSDKDVLNTLCPTPDCKSVIISITIYRQDSTVKRFTSEKVPNRKPNDKTKALKLPLSSEAKIRKRAEVKELRKQRHKEKKEPDIVENIPHDDSVKTPSSKYHLSDDSEDKNIPAVPSTSFTLLRKETEDEDIYKGKQPARKAKKRRDKQKTVLQVDVNFTDNKEEMLRLANSAEADCDDMFESVPGSVKEDIQNDLYQASIHQAPVFDACTETLFGYFADILSENGPLHVDDLLLTQEVDNFPVEAQTVINKAGNLKAFLKQSLKFAFIDDFVCVLKDAVRARELALAHGGGLTMAKALKKNLPSKMVVQNVERTKLNPDAPEFSVQERVKPIKGINKHSMDSIDDITYESVGSSVLKPSENIDEIAIETSPKDDNESFQTVVLKKNRKKQQNEALNNRKNIEGSQPNKVTVSKKTNKSKLIQQSSMLNKTKFDDISDEELSLPYKLPEFPIQQPPHSHSQLADYRDFTESSSSPSDISDISYVSTKQTKISSPFKENSNKNIHGQIDDASLDLIDQMNKVDKDLVSELTTSIVDQMCSQSNVSNEDRQKLMYSVSKDIWADFKQGNHPYYSSANSKQNEELTKKYIKDYYSRPDRVQFDSRTLNRQSSGTNYFDPTNMPWSSNDDDYTPPPRTYSLFSNPEPSVTGISSGFNISSVTMATMTNTFTNSSLYSMSGSMPARNFSHNPVSQASVHIQVCPTVKDASSNTTIEYVSTAECQKVKDNNKTLSDRLLTAVSESSQLQQTLTNQKEAYEKKLEEVKHNSKLLEIKFKQKEKELENQILNLQEESLQVKQQLVAVESREQKMLDLIGENVEKNMVIEENYKRDLMKVNDEKASLTQMMEKAGNMLEKERADLKNEKARSMMAEKSVLNLRRAADLNVIEQRMKEASFQQDEFLKIISSGDATQVIPLAKAKDCCDFWRNVLLKCQESKDGVQKKYTEAISSIESGKLLSDIAFDSLLLPPPPPDFMKFESLQRLRSTQKDPALNILQPPITTVNSGLSDNMQAFPMSPMNSTSVDGINPSTMISVMPNRMNPPASTTRQPPNLPQPRPLLPFGLPTAGLRNNTPDPSVMPYLEPPGISVPNSVSSGGGPGASPLMPLSTISRFSSPVRNSFDRIVAVIQEKFPNVSKNAITKLLADLRKKNSGSFTGMSARDIVSQISAELVGEIQVSNGQVSTATESPAKANAQNAPPGLDGFWAFMQRKNDGAACDPSVSDGELQVCVICHEVMVQEESVTVALECCHIFHEQCIKLWFKEQSTCPTCRTHCLLQEEFPSLK